MGKVAAYAKCKVVQMNLVVFKPSDLINITLFLHNFKAACNYNGVHEKGAIYLSQHFTKEPAKGALAHSMCATENDDLQKEGKNTTFYQVVNHMLSTCATKWRDSRG